MNELALFAGAGGGLLASQWLKGWRTVCYVERGAYPVEILKARIRDGLLHDAPIWDDVGTFDGRPWRGRVDIITAGFPCQPFSHAGKRNSNDDERNGWPDTLRIIREVQPRYVFLENVRGLLSAVDKTTTEPVPYVGTILRDLADSGYDARWRVLSAAELGAPHKRDRLWIVAYDGCGETVDNAQCDRRGEKWDDDGKHDREQPGATSQVASVLALPIGQRLEEREGTAGESTHAATAGNGWWAIEPGLGRVANGVANRVDRLTAIGNGQVPTVAASAWDFLMNR